MRGLKAMAVRRGTSLKDLLRTAVEHELALVQRPAEHYRVQFPVLSSKEAGTLDLTNANIAALLA